LFAQAEVVERSKKRSSRTGFLWKERPGSMKERMELVWERDRPGILPLTEDEAHWHFKQTLKASEWQIIRGLNTLRHSFVFALASRGVDQRIIDEFVGHQSLEQQRRYRHLYPGVQADALRGVFG